MKSIHIGWRCGTLHHNIRVFTHVLFMHLPDIHGLDSIGKLVHTALVLQRTQRDDRGYSRSRSVVLGGHRSLSFHLTGCKHTKDNFYHWRFLFRITGNRCLHLHQTSKAVLVSIHTVHSPHYSYSLSKRKLKIWVLKNLFCNRKLFSAVEAITHEQTYFSKLVKGWFWSVVSNTAGVSMVYMLWGHLC